MICELVFTFFLFSVIELWFFKMASKTVYWNPFQCLGLKQHLIKSNATLFSWHCPCIKIADVNFFLSIFIGNEKNTIFSHAKKLVYYYYWLQKCTLNVTPRRLRKNSFLPINYIVLTHTFKCQQIFSGLFCAFFDTY